jgi:peroxiredoxin
VGKYWPEDTQMEKLKVHSQLPPVILEAVDGRIMGPQDYRGKRNLLLVLFEADCESCMEFLCSVADKYSDYIAEGTEVMAIGEGGIEDLQDIVQSSNLPFPVLVDPEGLFVDRYSDETPAVFAADKFGEVRLVVYGNEFPDQKLLLDNFGLMELECPECGVPTWV